MCKRDYNGHRMLLRICYPNTAKTQRSALFNLLYSVDVVASMVITGLHVHACREWDCEEAGRRILARCHVAIHGLRIMASLRNCAHLGRDMRRRLQTIVSVNKRRFIDHELEVDLDLTYIADRVIGLALPCVDSAVYRNDIRQVPR
jgi:hypothetical protein